MLKSKFMTQLRASALGLALAGLTLGVAQAGGANPQSAAAAIVPDQIIVKFRNNAVAATMTGNFASAHRASMQRMRELFSGAQVYRMRPQGAKGSYSRAELEAMVEALKADPEVEYAEIDEILQAQFTPNDTYFNLQWGLADGVGGIDAVGAWDLSLGGSIVVAVLDTGYTTHTDFGTRVLTGYDFISSSSTGNDGNGRDSDARDPGDWCGASPSSWHGTHVMGIIMATTNNGAGIAGINTSARLLPVRVLGRCGGSTSDIADAVVWSSGGSVSGVPANANPARIINMSLGGSGACGTTMQNAINSATGRGSIVVVAAGNSNANSSGFQPASCSGVVTVAATDINARRASFSNYGSTVELAAPGVDIASTLNTGTTRPGQQTYAYYSGTSQATPHVAGALSLLLSYRPNLSNSSAISVLQQTAKPFAADTDCASLGCGVGIIDLGAAMLSVF